MYSRSTYGERNFPTPDSVKNRYRVPENYDGVAFVDKTNDISPEQREACGEKSFGENGGSEKSYVSLSEEAEKRFSGRFERSKWENGAAEEKERHKDFACPEKKSCGRDGERGADLCCERNTCGADRCHGRRGSCGEEDSSEKRNLSCTESKCGERDCRDVTEKEKNACGDCGKPSSPLGFCFSGDDLVIAAVLLLLMSGEEKGENDDLILLLVFLLFLH
ncbi:MAG: hypothetical protein ACI4QZ_02925 [Eubacteriales bacterium]